MQLRRKGGGKMNERLMNCSMAVKHTPAKQDTILLVEDDERVRHALHYFLQREDYAVIGAGSVKEAEKCIKEIGSENIAVIISDINLDPVALELGGYEFFLRWTAKNPALAFILISGDPTVGDLPAVRSKDVCFLAKPFNLYKLIAAVRSVLRKKTATGLLTSRHDSPMPYISEKEELK
jgi:DNA-binding NtrC family response regulator